MTRPKEFKLCQETFNEYFFYIILHTREAGAGIRQVKKWCYITDKVKCKMFQLQSGLGMGMNSTCYSSG